MLYSKSVVTATSTEYCGHIPDYTGVNCIPVAYTTRAERSFAKNTLRSATSGATEARLVAVPW